MIKIENTEVVGWEAAIRGMRIQTDSLGASDSEFEVCDHAYTYVPCVYIGPNDHNLMMNMAKDGSIRAKYRQMITVYCDITAPLYWWNEIDTYGVGMTDDSKARDDMLKITAKEFTLEDFSCEHSLGELDTPYIKCVVDDSISYSPIGILKYWTIPMLNACRERFLKTYDQRYWYQIINLLPASYNRKRTVMLNYEILSEIYSAQKNDILDEWEEFCKWIEQLPYSEMITGQTVKNYADNKRN